MKGTIYKLREAKKGPVFFFFFFFIYQMSVFGQGALRQVAQNLKKQQMEAKVGNYTTFGRTIEDRAAWARFNKASYESHPEFGREPFNAAFPGFVEVLEKRKIDERYFVNEKDPSEFHLQKAMGALHYKVNDRWITIDHRLADKGNGIYEASDQFDPVGFDVKKGISYIKTPKGIVNFNNWKLLGRDENGATTLLATASWSKYTAGEDGLFIHDVFPGIDAQMQVYRGTVKTSFIVRQLNFNNYTTLLFSDTYDPPGPYSFSFKGEAAGLSRAAAPVALANGSGSLLDIGYAVAFPKNGDRKDKTVMEYALQGNDLMIAVPVKWIGQYIGTGPVIIDPMVTSSNTLAQASITGSMYNGSCNFINSCNYNLTVNTPANSTLTDVQWSFTYLAQGLCFEEDGACRFTTGACVSPTGAGFYWYCNQPFPGQCIGTNISIFSDLAPCLPAPSCSPVPITFTMQFFRDCFGAGGCDNNCIGSNSPWVMTLIGHTVEFTNTVTAFSLPSNTVCAGSNLVATTSTQYGVPPRNVNWSFNPSGIPSVGLGNSPSINFPTAGSYTLYAIVTDLCGVTASASQVVTAVAIPTANAGPTKSLTCANASTVLAGSGGGAYSWSGPGIVSGGTTANPTVNAAGVYSLVVTSGGCPSAASTVAVNQNITPPAASANSTGSITCVNNSINLFSNPGGMSYTWTAPGGSSITGGVNNQNTTANGPGTYTVLVKDPSNGCSAVATVTANINMTAPSATASTSGSVTCLSSGINLSSNPAGMNYTWTAPAGSSISSGVNSQNAVGSGGGTYTVAIKDPANGCVASATVAANVNTVQPSPTTASPNGTITCATSTISLTGTPSAGVTYNWNGPGIVSGGTTANPVVNAIGNYTLTVTSSANGCQNTAVVATPVNTTAPSPVASSGGTITCSSTAITLSVTPASMNYTWSPPAGGSITSGINSQFATGTGAGVYSVTVKNPANGCSATGTVSPATNTTAIVPSINPTPSITCSSATITLTGNPSAGVTYTWSGPGIVSTPNQNIVNVNQTGSYTLTVTNAANGCTATVNAPVGSSLAPPTVTPGPTQTITCSTPSVQITGSATPSSCTVVWTGGVCAGATSYTATACSPNTYTFTATNPANGCSASTTVGVVPNSGIPSVTVTNSGTITCVATTVTITSTSTVSPLTYTWSGAGITSATNGPSITVNAGGVYTLAVTASNGCSSTITNSVTANNTPFTPTASASGTITCNTTSVTLTAGAGPGSFSYNWSGPGIAGTTTLSTATATLGGTYNVTVTNTSSGCVGTTTLGVTSDTAAPTSVSISPSTYTLPCSPPTATLTATATGASSYSWTAPAGGSITSGTTTANAGISGPGIYSVVATAANGCSAAPATATVYQSTLAPTYTLSNNSPSITCNSATPTVSVVVTSTVPISSYSWTPASGMSGPTNTSVATFTQAGTYTAVITATNGCTSNAIISVASATAAPAIVAGTGTAQAVSCANPTVVIAPTFTPSSANLTYTWTGTGIVGSANNASVVVNQSGLYTLMMTNTLTGCTSGSISIPVSGSSVPPTVTVTSSSTIGIGCTPATSTVTLTANTTPSTGVNYSWSTSATTPTIFVISGGVYSVTVTDAVTGCSVATQYTVVNNSIAPTVNAGANAALPCGAGATFTMTGSSTTAGVTYSWTGPGIVSGAATSSPVVNQPGIYTLTVSDATTGCTASGTVSIAASTVAAGFSADVTTGVAPLTVSLTNTSLGAVSYNWSFGNGSTSTQTNTSATYSTSGSYTIVLIASSGACADTSSLDITVSEGLTLEIPNVFTPNNDGVNDVFTITSTGVKEISLQIFNRWGQRMYEFTGAKAAWDGVNSNGTEVPTGTYFYIVKATGFDDKEVSKNGPVNLFR